MMQKKNSYRELCYYDKIRLLVSPSHTHGEGYVGLYRKHHLVAVGPSDSDLFEQSVFKICPTQPIQNKHVTYGDVVRLEDESGFVWNNKIESGRPWLNGYIGPRKAGKDPREGEMHLSFEPVNARNPKRCIRINDIISLSIECTHRKRTLAWVPIYSKTITCIRKARSEVKGGYLVCDGAGNSVQFQIKAEDKGKTITSITEKPTKLEKTTKLTELSTPTSTSTSTSWTPASTPTPTTSTTSTSTTSTTSTILPSTTTKRTNSILSAMIRPTFLAFIIPSTIVCTATFSTSRILSFILAVFIAVFSIHLLKPNKKNQSPPKPIVKRQLPKKSSKSQITDSKSPVSMLKTEKKKFSKDGNIFPGHWGMVQVENKDSNVSIDGEAVAENSCGYWCHAKGNSFQVRMPGYAVEKQKGTSGAAFFEPVAIDLFETPTRLDHVGRVMDIRNLLQKSPKKDEEPVRKAERSRSSSEPTLTMHQRKKSTPTPLETTTTTVTSIADAFSFISTKEKGSTNIMKMSNPHFRKFSKMTVSNLKKFGQEIGQVGKKKPSDNLDTKHFNDSFIEEKVKLKKIVPESESVDEQDDEIKEDGPIPDIVIVNIQLPNYSPYGFSTDGKGYSFVLCLRIKPEVKELMKHLEQNVSTATSTSVTTTTTTTATATTTTTTTTTTIITSTITTITTTTTTITTITRTITTITTITSTNLSTSTTSNTNNGSNDSISSNNIAVAARIAELKKVYNVKSLNLLKRYIQSMSPGGKIKGGDDLSARWKCIVNLDNPDNLGLNSGLLKLVQGFNGKPFLVAKTGRWFRGPGYFEIDVDVHCFATVARVSLWKLSDQAKDAQFNFGCVIQGNTDDELPEQMLSACFIKGIELTKAQPFPFDIPK